MVVTPVLKYGNSEHALRTKTLQGEKYQDNNEVVPYDTGKTFSYTDTIPYTDDMMVSTFEVRAQASRGDKKAEPFVMEIAKGVIVFT